MLIGIAFVNMNYLEGVSIILKIFEPDFRALPASGPIAAAWPAVIAPNMKQNIEMNMLSGAVGPSMLGHS